MREPAACGPASSGCTSLMVSPTTSGADGGVLPGMAGPGPASPPCPRDPRDDLDRAAGSLGHGRFRALPVKARPSFQQAGAAHPDSLFAGGLSHSLTDRTWDLDEVYLKINRRLAYHWRSVDTDGEVLDVVVQQSRQQCYSKVSRPGRAE